MIANTTDGSGERWSGRVAWVKSNTGEGKESAPTEPQIVSPISTQSKGKVGRPLKSWERKRRLEGGGDKNSERSLQSRLDLLLI